MPSKGVKGATTIGQRLSWLAYKALCVILRITDVRLVALAGRGAGYLVWAFFPSRRRIVARNLRIILDPRLRPHELRPMVRRNMVRTCMNLACSLKTGLMTPREMERSIRMEGADLFEQSGMNGHTVISCIPHAGNWEILARIRPHFSKVEHYGSMYRRMSNPLLEELVYRSRTRYGCEMFSKEEGLKAVLKLARTGGLLGVLSDQFTQEGIFLPYFGKVTGVTPLPALLYRRCKGKAHLFSVFTRNTGLGKWDAVLGRKIEVEEGESSMARLTMLVNLALEKCQRENILDGFWMHHRWKATGHFAPQQEEETIAVAAPYVKLPFRILVAMPEEFEEAALLAPLLRVLKASRADAQLIVICPREQKAYWELFQSCIAAVVTSDDPHANAAAQLEADELYQDGPYDILFMFNRSRKLMKSLKRLLPLYFAGWEDHPCAKKFRTRYPIAHTGPVCHKADEYLYNAARWHALKIDLPGLFSPIGGNPSAQGCYIAPFSTLGAADCWAEENWAELCCRLGHITLLALPQDEEKAREMADRLGISHHILAPEEVGNVLGEHCHLYAVDGLLPLLAAQAGCPCTVIMASRLPARYGLKGKQHRHLTRHLPCHPCYAKRCDMPSSCTSGITVDEMLAREEKS